MILTCSFEFPFYVWLFIDSPATHRNRFGSFPGETKFVVVFYRGRLGQRHPANGDFGLAGGFCCVKSYAQFEAPGNLLPRDIA